MATFSLLNTQTTVSAADSTINVLTYYLDENLGDILSVSISESVGTQNGVSFIENESLALMRDGSYPSSTNIEINSNGELEITSDDANRYSINSNGELEYTY